jgi:hypothetical protein
MLLAWAGTQTGSQERGHIEAVHLEPRPTEVAATTLTLKGQEQQWRGTMGAHQHEICPEALRTAEISAACQTACRVYT